MMYLFIEIQTYIYIEMYMRMVRCVVCVFVNMFLFVFKSSDFIGRRHFKYYYYYISITFQWPPSALIYVILIWSITYAKHNA